MKQIRFIINKLRLIYTSALTYWMIFLQVSFLVIYLYADNVDGVSKYVSILKKDYFLWIICIPAMVIQHKVGIFSTYYNCISRVGRKRGMILVDYLALAFSSCLAVFIVLFAPLIFLFVKEGTLANQEMFVNLFFLWARYVLLGLLVQYIIYAILYAFPKLQQKGGSICVLPFLFYFIFTTPMEFLRIKGRYIPALDFSAGGNYGLNVDDVVLWESVFRNNIHLAVYLALWIWMTVVLSARWEFWENESVGAL